MRSSAIIFMLLLCAFFVAPAAAQRVFDNFDRSQSVQVFLPPPAIAKAEPKKKRLRNGKWKVVMDDKLVQKTGSSRWTVSVTDGLAAREGQPPGVTPTKISMGSNGNLKGFTTGNMLHDAYIVDSARRYGIDPLLIYSQMHQESTFKINARSPKGASGLMQLMPATARRFGVTSIYDPKQNIEAGVRYMRWLLDTFRGDMVLALAGYNAGEGAVMKYGWQVPPYRETQEYVRRISSRYNQISDGRIVQTARPVSSQIASRLEQKDSRPLTVYEGSPLTVRLPNGQMMLMNQ
jgi:soluble lytic murein transglycosylase-like protein